MLAPEDTAIQPLDLELTWEGPFSLDVVRRSLADGGEPPDFDGNDYGVHQVYGEHILSGPNTLLYVGKACLRGLLSLTTSLPLRQGEPQLQTPIAAQGGPLRPALRTRPHRSQPAA